MIRTSRRRGLLVAGAWLLVGQRLLLAEFTVGRQIPSVALPSVDGMQVDLASVDGAMVLRGPGPDTKPSALVIHLLQPDCLQCRAQLKELQALSDRFKDRSVVVMGIAHRGGPDELKALARELSVTFPLLHGIASEIAKQSAAGDSLGIADKSGVVRYAQVGFGKGDEALWATAIEELLAGKPVSKTTVSRERLAVGDRFPAVELPSLVSQKPIALVGKGGRLTFRDEQGGETNPKAAVGFFSRY
jgi:peroxiredoxin